MMRVWPLVMESTAMVLLWASIVIMAMFTTLFYIFSSVHALYFVIGLGILHFVLNVWLVSLLRGKTNRCLLVFLALTQTTPLFLLCRRAWRSCRAGCDRNQVTKKHKTLTAKYALCNETSSSLESMEEITEEHSFASCIPHQSESEESHEDAITQETPTNGEVESGRSDTTTLKVTATKFHPNTKTIKLSFGGPEEIYVGEPKLYKFIVRNIQALYAEEKRLSYHIVLDSSHTIIHASKSNICAEGMPFRTIRNDPLTLCDDTHYIVNFVKGLGYQTMGVMKRDKDESQSFTQGDLSKLVWLLVWPCTALMIFSAIDYRERFDRAEKYIAFISPGLGVFIWLLTQRGVDDPWRNTLILIPLRLLFTVSRTILVCFIGSTWLFMAVIAYISAKVTGILSMAAYITYSKLVKNIELYQDATDMYTYNAMYEPIVQIPESLVYCCWGVWWQLYHLSPENQKLPVLLMIIISQVFGLTWLWFMRAFLKDPLHDPVQVLQMVKDREFSRT